MTQPSNQRILANDRNLVRDAALTPSSVKPIANAVMTLPQFRSGNGQVKVAGTYTGTDDATYDVEILDNIAALPIISKPTFKGSGNGTLAALTATGLAAQTFTITLADFGLQLLAAQTEFEGVTIRARAKGVSGNSIQIHVDNSPLLFTATAFSTIEDIRAGATDGLKGAQFDWDTKVLGGARAIPATAHRVAFGDDTSSIYLEWKEWKKDAWNYGFTPALGKDIAKGTKVKFVSAGRTVTVSDGTTTETYTNVVSLYDFLNAVKTTSALVEITGAVANDRAPGGQASVEFKLRTDAYAVANAGSNKLAAGGFEAVTIGAPANTEVIEARCIAANAKDRATAGVGSEIWALNGSVSGALGEIVSGSTYVEPSLPSKFALRVPRRVPDGFDKPRGKFSVTSIGYASRPGTTKPPDICVKGLTLGPSAIDQTVTLTYRKKAAATCGCDDLPFPDFSQDECLTGVAGTGGPPMSDITSRLDSSYLWRKDFYVVKIDGIAPLFAADETTRLKSLIDADFNSLINVLKQLSGTTSADLIRWDAIFTDFSGKADAITQQSGGGFALYNTFPYEDRRGAWVPWLDYVLQQAGKFEASTTVTGDGCWRDRNDAFFWTINGSVGGAYDRAFNNQPYVSSKSSADGKTHSSTREFAFQINVAANCVAQLKEGDNLTLSIGDAAWPATYQVGDTLSLSIIAAQDLFLAGGQAGTNLQTWYINGSVDGPRAPYIYDPSAPAPYSASGLGFTLTPGTIPFAKSDEFKFNIEAGHYRWRKDAGAWSANFDISTAALAFTDGLTIQFVPGAAPSFAPSDLHKFRVLQPNRVSNLRKPNFDQWAWDGANATLEIDFGAAQLIDAIMLTYHTLPSAAALTIEFATTPSVYGTPVPLTFHEHVIGKLLETPVSARYARLTISGAPFGRIGWLWLGSMLAAQCCQGQVKVRYDYNIERAGLINGGAQAYGKTVSGEIKWDTGALTDTDRVNFVQMFDHVKLNHDQAVVIYPHFLHEDEAYLARILDDKIEIADWNLYHPNDKANRALSVTLPFEGVIL